MNERVSFDLPVNKFRKSPTPVGKLTELEFQDEAKETDSPIKEIMRH